MRHLTKQFIFALITGCSTAPLSTVSTVESSPSNIPAWGVDTTVRFFSDLRPVDGNLDEIILTLKDGRYTATQHIVHGGRRPNPQPQDIETVIAERLSCTNQFADEIGTLTGVNCRYDARPVDGSLVEIIARLEDDARGYSLTKIVTPSGFGGNTEPVITELGSHMTSVIGSSELPKLLNCIDTATFSDGPGIASLIEINSEAKSASVTRTPVRLRGQDQEPSVLDENSYTVSSRTSTSGELVLSIVEDVDTNVDWATAGTCYRFFPVESFYVTKTADGNWTGRRQLLPVTKLDPSVANCSFPHLSLPPQIEIACSAVTK